MRLFPREQHGQARGGLAHGDQGAHRLSGLTLLSKAAGAARFRVTQSFASHQNLEGSLAGPACPASGRRVCRGGARR